jgi:RNA polymerase sigma-70 factor, ECF subfamily
MESVIDRKKEFSECALKYLGELHRFAMSLCRKEFDADDLVSETIVKAYENYDQLRDLSRMKQWLFRILNNQFLTTCRERRRFMDVQNENNNFKQGENFSLFEALGKSNYPENGNPEKNFISDLTQNHIEKAIRELPDEFRQALILCDMEDFSYAEIASILQVPIGTIRSRIARGRIILQKKLWEYAKELGIKSAKDRREDRDHICTCGKEETNIKPLVSEK